MYLLIETICIRLELMKYEKLFSRIINEPRHEISKNAVCVTSKASDQPAHTRSLIAHTRSLIRAFASGLSIL